MRSLQDTHSQLLKLCRKPLWPLIASFFLITPQFQLSLNNQCTSLSGVDGPIAEDAPWFPFTTPLRSMSW